LRLLADSGRAVLVGHGLGRVERAGHDDAGRCLWRLTTTGDAASREVIVQVRPPKACPRARIEDRPLTRVPAVRPGKLFRSWGVRGLLHKCMLAAADRRRSLASRIRLPRFPSLAQPPGAFAVYGSFPPICKGLGYCCKCRHNRRGLLLT
jgi:hypothetical protein